MNCQRKGTDDKIRMRLAVHKARTDELIAQYWPGETAGRKAYEEVTRMTVKELLVAYSALKS